MQGGCLVPPWSTFPQAPLVIPHGRISRVRLATLAVPTGPSHDNGCFNADSSSPLAPMVYLLAHASDHMPPAAFGRPSDHGSVQVVVSPCWQMARPGVISAVLV